MGVERDYQRTWLYRSEWEIIDEFDELSLPECWQFLAKTITSKKFVKRFPKTYEYLAKNWETSGQTHPQEHRRKKLLYLYSGDKRSGLKLRPGYRRKYAEAHCSTITLPCWSRNKLTLLHELAHICCWSELPNGSKVSAHGQEFAAIYLILVEMRLGKSVKNKLFDAMRQHKVKVAAIGTP